MGTPRRRSRWLVVLLSLVFAIPAPLLAPAPAAAAPVAPPDPAPQRSPLATHTETTTERVSVSSAGAQSNAESEDPALSGDGRRVAFTSTASNLVAGDTNAVNDVFVHDRAADSTTRVSVSSAGGQASERSSDAGISADGSAVAFRSEDDTLVSGDTHTGGWDIFVHELGSGTTSMASVSSAGAVANGTSGDAVLSADGRFVAFSSSATNLVSGDTNGTWDVFVHDRDTAATTRVSVVSGGAQASGRSEEPAISASGRYVAFWSDATNLVAGDTNAARDIFVHDRDTGTTTRVSLGAAGAQSNGASDNASISDDGSLVAFDSLATNLVSGDTNARSDAFVHDRSSGATTRVSVSSAGTQGDGNSDAPSISGDGRWVAFPSTAQNLISGDTNNRKDIFIHDRSSGATTRASVGDAGQQGASGHADHPAIGADASVVAFQSGAANLVSGDTNAVNDIFVRAAPMHHTADAGIDGTGRYGRNGLWSYTTHEYGGGNSSAVEISTGNLAFSHAGGSIDARGFSVDLTHTFNSTDPYGAAAGGVFGEGWTFSHNLRLFERDDDTVVFKDGTGDESRVFEPAGDAGGERRYDRPLHYGLSLTKDLGSPPADAERVWTMTTDAGALEHFFDADGKLTRIEDRNDNFLDFSYDGSGRLTTITDVAERDTLLEYAASGGRLSEITDMAGGVSTYAYDGAGNLTAIKHAVGSADEVTTSLGYDAAGLLDEVTSPNGHSARVRYELEHDWESLGDTEGWAANAGSLVSQSALQAFSGSGSLQITLNTASPPPGERAGAHRELATPEAWNALPLTLEAWAFVPPTAPALTGRLVLSAADETVADGPEVTLTPGAWTAVRFPRAPIDPGAQVGMVAFEVADGGTPYAGPLWLDRLAVRGLVAELTDAATVPVTVARHTYQPDEATTLVGRPDDDGAIQDTTLEYGDDGEVTKATDPLGNESINSFDEFLRLTDITLPGGTESTYAVGYYPNSIQLQTAAAESGETVRRGANLATGDTRYALDPLNEGRRFDGEQYNATILTRDAAGNVTAAITNTYAAGSDLESDPFPAAAAELRRIDFAYGTGGLLTSMTDPLDRVVNFGYDADTGYLTSIDAPAGSGEGSRRVTSIARNPDGTVDTITDAKGLVTAYDYDALGRLTAITYAAGTPDEFSHAYELDANGNLTAMDDAAGSTDWAYDANNRPTSEARTQNAVTNSAEYAYYANGLLEALTTFGDETVSFDYDAALRLISQTDPASNDAAIGFGYDSRSRRTSIDYPSGVSHTQTYDDAGRVSSILLERADGTDLQSFAYDYGFDAGGARTAAYAFGYVVGVTELDGSEVSYQYDDLARLVGATRTGSTPFEHAYAYDLANNRTSFDDGTSTTTFSYDAANQLTGDGTLTYSYDRNGNLTGFGSNTLAYDGANKWVDGTIDSVDLAYAYDGLGRQVSRTEDSTDRTDLWFDTTGMTLESGASELTYLRDPGGLPLSVSDGTSVHNYGRDRLGSITALTAANGSLAATTTYAPYGGVIASSGSVANSLGFTAGRLDPATGWNTFGQRTYAPDLGRFTTLDPLPESITDLNRFAYAGCNPANFIDPTGLSHCTTAGTVSIGLGWVAAVGGFILVGITAPISVPVIATLTFIGIGVVGAEIGFLDCVFG